LRFSTLLILGSDLGYGFTMKKVKILIICASFILLFNTSFSDIAPTPNCYSGVPLPTDPSDSTFFNKIPIISKRPFINVSMAAETVLVDLYPTFLKIKAVFRMKGGEIGAGNLTAGFPENIYKHFTSPPLDNLTITVNDKKVITHYYTNNASEYALNTLWWFFKLDVPPEKDVKVVVSYYQFLYKALNQSDYYSFLDDTSTFMGGYIFRTGALWKNNIGYAKIRLSTHGEIDKYLKLYPTPHESSKNSYRWEYFDWNPINDLSIVLNFPNKYLESISSGKAPYNLENISPRICFLDRLLRFQRSRILTEEKIDTLISAVIEAANQNDDYELKLYAHKILDFFRNNIKEYTDNLYKYLDPADQKLHIKNDEDGYDVFDIKNGTFNTDKWDEICFRTDTKLGMFLHNIAKKNALSSLTPKEIIEVDSSFVQDRLYNDGLERFKRFKNYLRLIDGRSSEYGSLGLIGEDYFMKVRRQYRTIIITVLGMLTGLSFVILYFSIRLLKNKYQKK
jgi:hypothetical protein